ncbi:MAG: general secretion pathway protein GspK [Nitrospirae bacterium]|nr:general secretion pathway protein GspK [Nitrospirota bacterium]
MRFSRGSATILALLITGVVITVGIGFNWMVKEHLKAAEGMKRKSEAMVKAVSTYNTLMYGILSGITTPAEIVFNTSNDLLGVKSIPLNSAGVTVNDDAEIKIQDSNGMISLASPNLLALQRLFRNASPAEDNSAIIIDSYLDWISTGSQVRINGAKAAYYKAQGKPYTARNRPMQYKEELSFVRGMDQELYKKISPYVTLLPNSGFNPNTACDAVLSAYLGIAEDAVLNLKTYMSQKPVSSNSGLYSIVQRTVGGEGVDFIPSQFWDITISVGKPDPVYSLKAGIDKRWNATYPYSVIYWEKG